MYPGRPTYVSGTNIEVEIPFNGDPNCFRIQPNPFTLNPPRASIRESILTFSLVVTDPNLAQVRAEIDQIISEIQNCLGYLRKNMATLNEQLLGEARTAIEARRAKLLEIQNIVANLGFKLKVRENAPKTVVAPEVRRKIAPVMPPVSSAPFKPEPVLDSSDYEHILSVMQSMTLVMEYSPSAFRTLNEESLRTHFLVQLNGHYQGQATGETFNYEGKTDILVRSEGRNIFIAECKFWSGPKNLSETIDQLLGYSSWRDTKTAIVLLNRNRDFSKVLNEIPDCVRSHPKYKRDLQGSSETAFRYLFSNRDDVSRELFLTVLAFDVPTPRQ